MKAATRMGRRAILVAAGASLAGHALAAVSKPKAANCLPTFSDGGGPVLIIVVDRTAPRSRSLNEKILESVARAAQAGMRIVLWIFGGTKPLPVLLQDVRLPIITDRPLNLATILDAAMKPSGAKDAVKVCETDMLDMLRSGFLATLRSALAEVDSSDQGVSPVLLAINTALAPFQFEAGQGFVTLLVASDGFEFCGTGAGQLSFYPTADGRFLSPAQAMARSDDALPGSWTGARIHMAGIGNSTNPDVRAVAALQAIWRSVITHRGGVVGDLSVDAVQRLEVPR